MAAPGEQFPVLSESCNSALLLATLSDLSLPHFLAPVIIAATTTASHRLVIVLLSRLFNVHKDLQSGDSESVSFPSDCGISHIERWDDVQQLLTFVYVQATKVAQDLDKLLLQVDVLLKGFDDGIPAEIGSGMDMVFRVDGDSIPVPLPLSLLSVQQQYIQRALSPFATPSQPTPSATPISSDPRSSPKLALPSLFPVVALGGTFDHLHAGHKILLSMAAWIAQEKIIVGVTDDALLVKKSNREFLESLDERMKNVRDFLSLFRPGLVYDIVPISDVYGPTGWDPNIQALVVSKETLSGAESIAKHRESHSLPALQTFVIDVISHKSSNLDHSDMEMLRQTKMSSTFIREWLAKRKLDAEKGEA